MYDRVHQLPFAAIGLDGKIVEHRDNSLDPQFVTIGDIEIDSSSSAINTLAAELDAAVRGRRCETMLAHPTAAVAIVEAGRIRTVNAAWRTLFAMPTGESADGASDDTVAGPIEGVPQAALFASVQVAERFDRMLRDRLAGSRDDDDAGAAHAVIEHPLVRLDGTGFLGELLVWPLARGGDDVVDAIWQVRDVTADRALHGTLRDLEDYHRALAEHQRDLTFVIDRKGRIAYVSPSVDRTLGFPVGSLIGRNFASVLQPGHRTDTERWLRRQAIRRHDVDEPRAGDDYRLHVVAHAGVLRVLACHPHDCFDVPRLSGLVLHAREVTDESDPTQTPSPIASAGASAEGHLAVDPLTSLMGRVDAAKRLAALVGGHTSARALLVLLIDIDRMCEINDRHGHAVGDRVIAEAARRLAHRAGGAGFAARVGGDEFLLVLAGTDLASADAAVDAVLEDLASAPPGADTPRIEASIGAARLTIDSSDADALWRNADLAMREAKRRGRGQIAFFHPRLAIAIGARTALGAEIEGALATGEFVPFYQPQISLTTGRLVGLEALLRWQHPVRGLLLPDLFIEAAIARGLIDAVTKAVFGQVCDQIVLWQKQPGFPEVPVSVNVSAQQFHDRRLPALVASALLRTGLPARLLILELTEQHLVVDSAATERVVKELMLLGVRIAIGSFGLDHASLRSLHQLRVSQIKLDRGFVERLPEDQEGAIVIEAAIEIGRRLKCQVIAEGVETRAQYECLRDRGCEAGQGFYFGAPLSAVELETFIEANRVDPVR